MSTRKTGNCLHLARRSLPRAGPRRACGRKLAFYRVPVPQRTRRRLFETWVYISKMGYIVLRPGLRKHRGGTMPKVLALVFATSHYRRVMLYASGVSPSLHQHWSGARLPLWLLRLRSIQLRALRLLRAGLVLLASAYLSVQDRGFMAVQVSMATSTTASIRNMDTTVLCRHVVHKHSIISRPTRPVTAKWPMWSQHRTTAAPENTRCLVSVEAARPPPLREREGNG